MTSPMPRTITPGVLERLPLGSAMTLSLSLTPFMFNQTQRVAVLPLVVRRMWMTAGIAAMTAVAIPVARSAAQSTPSTSPAARFADSARVEIDAAVVAHDTARLERAMVLLDRALTVFPNDPYLLHYRGYGHYRRIINLFQSGAMAQVPPLIQRGIADLEASSSKLAWPETFSLLSALTAFRIAVDPNLGRTLGAEIGELSGRAVALGPENPRVLLMQARGAMQTPVEYGGGPDRARAYLERAISAFERDKPQPLAPTWGREEAAALKKQLGG